MKSFTAADIAEMLSFIPTRPDYDKWLRIASAVWSELPAGEGAMLLNQWSPEEQDGEYMAKHKARLRRITIGSLVHYAKEGGWKGRRGTRRSISRNTPSSLRLTRTARNSRPIWLSPIKPKSPIVDVARAGIVEQSPAYLSSHGVPPGRCAMCWTRWGRFLREDHCICTGDVQR
jgi:Primase C terminal 2 (PriCT-2)